MNTKYYNLDYIQDVFGSDKTAQHSGTRMASTKYFRFNPIVGEPDTFPIDETDPDRLQELCDIVDEYMTEDEQQMKLKQLNQVIHPKSWVKRAIQKLRQLEYYGGEAPDIDRYLNRRKDQLLERAGDANKKPTRVCPDS